MLLIDYSGGSLGTVLLTFSKQNLKKENNMAASTDWSYKSCVSQRIRQTNFHFFEVFRSSFDLSNGEKIILHAKAFPKSHLSTAIETTNFAFYLGFNDVSSRNAGCVMKSEILPKFRPKVCGL